MSRFKMSDYYTRDIGIWGDKGAEILKLKGEVERKDFVALITIGGPELTENDSPHE
jgi:hypothetical protein